MLVHVLILDPLKMWARLDGDQKGLLHIPHILGHCFFFLELAKNGSCPVFMLFTC